MKRINLFLTIVLLFIVLQNNSVSASNAKTYTNTNNVSFTIEESVQLSTLGISKEEMSTLSQTEKEMYLEITENTVIFEERYELTTYTKEINFITDEVKILSSSTRIIS